MDTNNNPAPEGRARSSAAAGYATVEWHDGIPAADGYYLVELEQGSDVKTHDVDYCRAKSKSDGGGREWATWYVHNVARWASLPPCPSHNDEAERTAGGAK